MIVGVILSIPQVLVALNLALFLRKRFSGQNRISLSVEPMFICSLEFHDNDKLSSLYGSKNCRISPSHLYAKSSLQSTVMLI